MKLALVYDHSARQVGDGPTAIKPGTVRHYYRVMKENRGGRTQLTTSAGRYRGEYTDYSPHIDETHLINQLQRIVVEQMGRNLSPQVISSPDPHSPSQCFFFVVLTNPVEFAIDASGMVLAKSRDTEPPPVPVWRQEEMKMA